MPNDRFVDHCGVAGILGHAEAAKLTYLMLYGLQHRGQDSAGIVSNCENQFFRHVGKGLVADVFNQSNLEKLPGESAVGHVRYTTAGGHDLQNAQPLLTQFHKGNLAVAHNGNLTNAEDLKASMIREGAIFHSQSDTELFSHLVARSQKEHLPQKLLEAFEVVRGAYSLVLLSEEKLIGVRDPLGIRPLVLGSLNGAHVLASEDSALRLIDATFVRDIAPGEMVVCTTEGIESYLLPNRPEKSAQCIFEHVYFSRPDSRIFGQPVHQTRKSLGLALALEMPCEADVVIPVPDSGVLAAMGYAEQSGIPFEFGLVRNHYVGRTFIEPDDRIRNFGVRLKLAPVPSIVKGKRLVVVDDSLVRGTTSKKIVQMLREAGAKEVHFRVAAPPTKNPCFYGIDTPSKKELIASNASLEAIADYIQVDSLAYLSLEALHAACPDVQPKGLCDACFSGKYPL